jgi:hypothetical protein
LAVAFRFAVSVVFDSDLQTAVADFAVAYPPAVNSVFDRDQNFLSPACRVGQVNYYSCSCQSHWAFVRSGYLAEKDLFEVGDQACQ